MRFIAYRNLIGVSHTEAEAKAEAEEMQVGTIVTIDLIYRQKFCRESYILQSFPQYCFSGS